MAHSTTSSLTIQNFFTTTLSGNVATSDTVINLTNVPAGSEGYLVIDPNSLTGTREIIYYNSKTSSTVTTPDATQGSGRGVGGTTAQTHTTGTLVEMRFSAEHWLALQNGQSLSAGSITSTNLAAGVLSPANFSNPYKFSVYKTTGQTSVSTTAKITWDTELFDTNNNFATSTYTAPLSGFYLFHAQAYVASSTTFCHIDFYKNGSLYKPGDAQSSSTSGDIICSNSALLQLTATDTIDVRVAFTGGGTRNVFGVTDVAIGTTGPTTFEGFLVSAT